MIRPGTVLETDKNISCRPHCKKIPAILNLPALNELFSKLKYPSILGANTSRLDAGRFSYWAASPIEIFEFGSGGQNPFEKLHNKLAKYQLEQNFQSPLPKETFCGGWIGYLGYELGRFIEQMSLDTSDDLNMPLVRLCFYDKVICYDHREKICWLIALELPYDKQTPAEKIAELEKLLAKSQDISLKRPLAVELDSIDFSQIRSNMSKDKYLHALEKIKLHIYDGDVYQINFSQRFESAYKAKPIDLYHWQNLYNPSPYSAYIDCGKTQIVSASPEMFVSVADGVIKTKPIKGTRPFLKNDSKANAKNFNDLLKSEKEQAELNMIIDLERNDLGRICEYGSIEVIQPRTIETYPSVFHAVATIQGRLRKEVCFCDILKAMFPGGSITGAPKVSAMQIIEQLEPNGRGVYTGCIGFIGLDGNVSLNIAIRTIIITNKKAYAQTGGGIVADSIPEAEWQESIVKAKALLAGIKSVMRRA